MNIQNFVPTELLQPFIKTYIIIESQDGAVNRVLPDTSLVIAFRLTGQVNYINDSDTRSSPSSAISGLRKSVRLINYQNNTSTILILFKEAGAAAFFKEPLHELFEHSIPLDTFIKRQEVSNVEEQLAAAKNNNQRVAIVEAFLLSKMYYAQIDKLIINAIQKIRASNGIIKIKELAGSLYISQDAFEKRFRKIIGTSPKQFAAIIRMRSVIDSRRNTQTFSDMAFEGSYFDQAHFNRDFKLFTGQAPTEFFKTSSFW